MRLRRLGAPERTRVWAMIETPLAILHAGAIASAARDVDTRLDCFVMGTNDLAKETRARLVPGRAPDAALADDGRSPPPAPTTSTSSTASTTRSPTRRAFGPSASRAAIAASTARP